MIPSSKSIKKGLIGIVSTCLLAYGLTLCKNPYVRTEKSFGNTIETISLPVNKGVYRGLFHKPIIYGGMDGNHTFYLYPSYDDGVIKDPFDAALRHIRYGNDEYDVEMLCRDSIRLRHVK